MMEVKNAAAVLVLGLLFGAANPVLAQGAQQHEQQREQMRQHQVEPGTDQPGRGMMQTGAQGMMGRAWAPA